MGLNERAGMIRKIEQMRGSTVICYLTSIRKNVPAQIAEDQVRVFFDHLPRAGKRPLKKLDIFLCSNGGAGTVPWRLTALFREFADRVGVLLPYRAYSAASLVALGADEIVMHPFAEMGPIDPSVSNAFNPVRPDGQQVAISVEDVRAYVTFVKQTMGITHEDELVEGLKALTSQVHPLALGNVERFLSQSRMIARKILRTHMPTADGHTVDDIVENMAAKLYFHGHPINRQEAKDDLKLKVVNPDAQLETVMWDLYLDYESEFKNREPFEPHADLLSDLTAAAAPAPLSFAGTVTLDASGPAVRERTYDLLNAAIESRTLSSRHVSRKRFLLHTAPAPNPPGQMVQEMVLSQRWESSEVPSPEEGGPTLPAEHPPEPSPTSQPDARVAPGEGKSRRAKSTRPQPDRTGAETQQE